jgi:hypothetical protein
MEGPNYITKSSLVTVWDKEIAIHVIEEGLFVGVVYHCPVTILSTRTENMGPAGYLITV